MKATFPRHGNIGHETRRRCHWRSRGPFGRRKGPVNRRIQIALFALATAFTVLPTATPAQARRRPPPPDPDERVLPIPLPGPRLTAHEWGVFVIENGQPAYLEALAAELPPFVQRQAGAAVLPPHPPRPHPGPRPGTVARKPVLFLYADRPTQVQVRVGFAGGEPWLLYPTARRVENIAGPNAPGLVWDLLVAPARAPAPPSVHPGHWWNDLRAVGASPVVAADGTNERFLFYDGPVAFEPSFLVSHAQGGASVSPVSTERTLFLVGGDRFVEVDVDPATWSSRQVSTGDMTALRARIDQALQQRGLTGPEARSLLETWRDELFRDVRRRAIYFVPREAYDRMLPITITPTPTELVRVGLVIDRG